MEPRISYISPRLNEEALQHAIAYNLMFILGKDPSLANKHEWLNATLGNDSNLLIVFYVQIVPDDFVMHLHRF